MAPTEQRLRANGLEHHLLRWDGGGEPVVLLHGFLDIGWSWRAVAEQLAAAGYCAIAVDFRGHGETDWIGPGGYYHFWDYLLDLDELLPQLLAELGAHRSVDGRLHLVGHSLGGIVTCLYGSVAPERLRSLTVIEGLGRDGRPVVAPVARAQAWLEAVARVRRTSIAPIATLDEVVRRMRVQNPELDAELGLFLAEKATRPVEGGYLFRFDPLHRTPLPFSVPTEQIDAFLEGIALPTLVVAGEHGYRGVEEARRRALLRPRAFVEVPGVGHMVHWFAPHRLAEAILEHLEVVASAGPAAPTG